MVDNQVNVPSSLPTNPSDQVSQPSTGNEVPSVTSVPDVGDGKNVTLPASTLQRILEQLDNQDAAIKILKDAANQGRLTDAENKTKPAELPKAYLKIFLGKIVIGWKTERAETLYNPTNPNVPVGEVLKATYTFLDGTTSGIQDQILFTRCEDRVIARILNGKEALKDSLLKVYRLKFEELITSDDNLRSEFVLPVGEYEIHKDFLNP